MKKSFLFVSCEEAKHICDKKQYDEATGWERIKLGLRLSWCKFTRAYSTNNHKLTKVIEKAEVNCMKEDEREKLNQQFEKELANHQ